MLWGAEYQSLTTIVAKGGTSGSAILWMYCLFSRRFAGWAAFTLMRIVLTEEVGGGKLVSVSELGETTAIKSVRLPLFTSKVSNLSV